MKELLVLTGASGAGKTTVARRVEAKNLPNVVVRCFDTIGVPSFEQMVREVGSLEAWQRAKTIEWIGTLSRAYAGDAAVLFDGQTRAAFVREGCQLHGVTNYQVVLFDCSDAARRERLAGRGQPELASAEMMNWARYLRVESQQAGDAIIDTTELTVEQAEAAVLEILRPD